MSKCVVLKKGKEKVLMRRHPWIFSGAVQMYPGFEEGEVLRVISHKGDFLALAFFHRERSLAGRVLSFEEEGVKEALEKRIREAIALRKGLFDLKETTAYRVINAEGDSLPGLIVDLYCDVCVLQVNILGMWRRKEQITELLVQELGVRAVYEKSTSIVRDLEGLEAEESFLHGEAPDEVEVLENGMRLIVNFREGQKTGFFLDQREMRTQIRELAKGKRVLNCFSYTGGFSIAALMGGAEHVTSVDCSEAAIDLCRRHTTLNDIDPARHRLVTEDAFAFLKNDPLDYDLIILDPPSFAKRKASIPKACYGYKELNRHVFKKARPGTLLLTCSCTGLVTPPLFQDVIAQSAAEEHRTTRILGHHREALDHPHSLFHPEGRYLKSLLLHLST